MMAARLIVSALVPFVIALGMEWLGISQSLTTIVGLGLLALALFILLGQFRRHDIAKGNRGLPDIVE